MKNFTLNQFLVFFICILFLWGCNSDDDMGNTPSTGLEKDRYGLVVNEGGFQQANATLGLIDLDERTFNDSFFIEAANAPLGDIFQSIYIEGDVAYLVVNNSGTIEVLNLSTAEHLGTISGLSSPRYLEINGTTAYATNLFENHLQVIDLSTFEVTAEIPFPGWSEQLIWLEGQLFVSCINCEHAYLIDPVTAEITDSVFTGPNTGYIKQLNNNNMVVVSTGSFDGTVSPSITLINSELEILDAKYLSAPNFNGAVDIDLDRNTLYFADESVYSVSLLDSEIGDPQNFIDTEGKSIYKITAGPGGDLYLTNARDFSSQGEILVYDHSGNFIYALEAGILPSTVYFY